MVKCELKNVLWRKSNTYPNFISSSGSGTVINYGSGSGSDFLTSYGSGSGSTSQKVTVPTVPVPVPQHWNQSLEKIWKKKIIVTILIVEHASIHWRKHSSQRRKFSRYRYRTVSDKTIHVNKRNPKAAKMFRVGARTGAVTRINVSPEPEPLFIFTALRIRSRKKYLLFPNTAVNNRVCFFFQPMNIYCFDIIWYVTVYLARRRWGVQRGNDGGGEPPDAAPHQHGRLRLGQPGSRQPGAGRTRPGLDLSGRTQLLLSKSSSFYYHLQSTPFYNDWYFITNHMGCHSASFVLPYIQTYPFYIQTYLTPNWYWNAAGTSCSVAQTTVRFHQCFGSKSPHFDCLVV